MKKYNMNDVQDYNQFLDDSRESDLVLLVCPAKEYESHERYILEYAEYIESYNPDYEVLIALYWQDSETGEYECHLYLHKKES